jgi:hypothetical protein
MPANNPSAVTQQEIFSLVLNPVVRALMLLEPNDRDKAALMSLMRAKCNPASFNRFKMMIAHTSLLDFIKKLEALTKAAISDQKKELLKELVNAMTG